MKPEETLESALRRFRKRCNLAGLRSEMRRRAYYEKPSDRRRRRLQQALRRRK